MRIQFTLTGVNAELAAAYEADRHIPIAHLARSALLSAIKRDTGRSGLGTTIREMVRVEVENALATPRASAEGQ